MAVPHNNKVNIPLAAPLNFSKLQTGVQPYNGYNDLNSPIYNDCISPLYTKERSINEIGNNRPYRDGNILYDKNGQELLNISSYKGIVREELDIPLNTLAVYDNDNYIYHTNSYQTIFHHNGENTILNYKATCARYLMNDLVAITSYNTLYIYNRETAEIVTSEEIPSSITKNIISFEDTVDGSQMISIYEPFGDWDYLRGLNLNNEYFIMIRAKDTMDAALREWQAALGALNVAKKEWGEATQHKSDLIKEYNDAEQAGATEEELAAIQAQIDLAQQTEITKHLAVINAQSTANSKETNYNNEKEIYEQKKEAYEETQQTSTRTKVIDHFLGCTSIPPKNFKLLNNTLTELTFNVNLEDYHTIDIFPSADSYILTGMYDETHYRCAVNPYSMITGTVDPPPTSGSGDANPFQPIAFYWSAIKIPTDTLAISKDETYVTNAYLNPQETPMFLTSRVYPYAIKFSGTGRYYTPSTFCEVLYDDNAGVSQTVAALKANNKYYDLGKANYNYYNPYIVREHPGNVNNIVGTYYNYEVSSDYVTDADYIFREIINNGTINNISVTPNTKDIGTFLETPLSIDDTMPVYYKNGRNGNEIVYKLNSGKWIDTKIVDSVQNIKVLNDKYLIIETPEQANCVDLTDGSIRHWSPDWNNRFSLVGSPYKNIEIAPLEIPIESHPRYISSSHDNEWVEGSSMYFASGINSNFEVSGDSITGYTAATALIENNKTNVTPVGFVSSIDTINIYAIDTIKTKSEIPAYYTSISAETYDYRTYNDIILSGLLYPNTIINIPGLFYNIRPTNFGRYYLQAGDTFYSLILYNGKMYYAYYTSSVLDDIRELFMVQGQTFAISSSGYLYSVNLNPVTGAAALGSAVICVEGLTYCGSIPEAAIFYSPMTKTLKSFTADHVLKTMQEATKIDDVYYTTYNPQTQSVYIATNNGLYIYGTLNQFRLPIINIKEVYFSKNDIYVIHDDNFVTDISYNKIEDYDIKPVNLTTRYYGPGNNGVIVTDCIYFRLYNEDLTNKHFINIKEKTITDNTYKAKESKSILSPVGFDKDTNTCYFRYQPNTQRSAGLELNVETDCGISEIVFSISGVDTTAISKPTFNS